MLVITYEVSGYSTSLNESHNWILANSILLGEIGVSFYHMPVGQAKG
jgi:hypothetical protein